ncbi:hypothetical protein QSI_3965 [Clostridioides difficile P28]|nr:hypothetical protein QSI_3965 [Clostridioides difficile P28]
MCILYGGFLQSAFDLDGSSMIPAYENSRSTYPICCSFYSYFICR